MENHNKRRNPDVCSSNSENGNAFTIKLARIGANVLYTRQILMIHKFFFPRVDKCIKSNKYLLQIPSQNLVIYLGLKNSNIEHEKFMEYIICKLLQKHEAKKKTTNHYVTFLDPEKKSNKRDRYKMSDCGKLTMWECEACLNGDNHLSLCVPQCF